MFRFYPNSNGLAPPTPSLSESLGKATSTSFLAPASPAIWPHYRWVAFAQGPYFVWVSIAMVLQLSITAMNWGNP